MADETAPPIYRRVKDAVLARIETGDWPAGHRIPSEAELVRSTGASRMTVHRALRELAFDGHIRRVQGAGSFVAERKAESDLLTLHNIADEIATHGGTHTADLIALAPVRLAAEDAARMGLPAKADAFRSVVVHREDGRPVQLEERLVNPAVAPGYLDADLAAETPNAYLTRIAPASAVEHAIEAAVADGETAERLEVASGTPCLIATRRTWNGDAVASLARLTYPAERYRLTAGRSPRDDVAPI